MWSILLEIDNGGAPNETIEIAGGFDCAEDAENAVPFAVAACNYRVECAYVAKRIEC